MKWEWVIIRFGDGGVASPYDFGNDGNALFVKERMENNKSHPLLSCRDIVELLSHFLPRRDVCEEEVLRQMEQRHKKRRSSIDSAYRKQQLMRDNTIIANVTK